MNDHPHRFALHEPGQVGNVVDVTDANAQPAEPASTPPAELDLARVSADLDGVEAALGRLDDGSYWTDEVTGDAIPDDVLAANPVTRRTA